MQPPRGCLLFEGQKWVVLTCGFCMFRLLLIAKWCLICVCGLNQFLWLISLLLSHWFSPRSFLSFTPPPVFAAVSCDLDEPASWFAHMEEAGFQKVPEDDSTTASRVSCLWELHWDKLHLSTVLFLAWRGLTLNPDETDLDFLFLIFFSLI